MADLTEATQFDRTDPHPVQSKVNVLSKDDGQPGYDMCKPS